MKTIIFYILAKYQLGVLHNIQHRKWIFAIQSHGRNSIDQIRNDQKEKGGDECSFRTLGSSSLQSHSPLSKY